MSTEENTQTRRELLKTAGAGAASIPLATQMGLFAESVKAQSGQEEPRIQLGNDWAIDDRSGTLHIEHLPTGSDVVYDGSTLSVDDLDVSSKVSADSADVTNGVTAGSVNTDVATIGGTRADRPLERVDTVELADTVNATVSVDLSNFDMKNRKVILEGDGAITSPDDYGLELQLGTYTSEYVFTSTQDYTSYTKTQSASSWQLIEQTGANTPLGCHYELYQGFDYQWRDASIRGFGHSDFNSSRLVSGYASMNGDDTAYIESLKFTGSSSVSNPAVASSIEVYVK